MGESGRTRESYFYGESLELSINSNLTLFWHLTRTLVITATTSGLSVRLPPAKGLNLGGPMFYVIVEGSNSITLKDWGNGTVATLSPDDFATVHLVENSTNAGTWKVHVGTQNTVVNPPAAVLGYIIGGLPSSSKVVWEYNQQLSVWTQKTDSPRDRNTAGMFVISTSGYIFGGDVGVTSCDEYDPPTFTAKTAMGTYAHSHSGAQVSNLGYRIGGQDGGSQKTTEEFNPSGAGTWTDLTDMPVGTLQGSCDAAGGKVYNVRGQATNVVYELTPGGSGTWAEKVARPGVNFRYFPTMELNGSIFSFMGSPDSSTRYRDTDEYDPTAGTWTAKTDWPYSSGKFEHSGYQIGGKCFIANDQTATEKEHGTFEDIGAGLWTALSDIPYSPRRHVYNTGKGITA